MRPRGLVPPVLMTSILGSTFICIKLDCECHANATGVLRVLLAAGVLLIRWLRGLRMPPEPVVSVHCAVATTVGNVVLTGH